MERYGWQPLDEAAQKMQRSAERIRSQIKNGRLVRGQHYRVRQRGVIELNVDAYFAWLGLELQDRRPPLVERIKQTLPAATLPAFNRERPRPQDARPTQQKLIPLMVWAEQVFGEHVPPLRTLRSWCSNGKIRPAPRKIGRSFYCSVTARYHDERAERLDQIYGD